MTGNYDLLIPKLQTTAREQLRKQGLSEEEINALISTDWIELEELGKARLAEAIAIQTGLSLDITRSLLNGDWEKVKNYGQIELIQRLVQVVLNARSRFPSLKSSITIFTLFPEWLQL